MGICLGASTITAVQLSRSGGVPGDTADGRKALRIIASHIRPHGGNPKKVLKALLETADNTAFDAIAVTGRKFQKFVNLSAIPEPEAVELAYHHVKPPGIHCPAVVSAGGETFMAYVLDPTGRIANVMTGNKCASGTGEFFLQQLRRMDVPLEKIETWGASEEPHHVSGRCSVFCKSDCTHATNKGVPKSQVTAGLCVMMANKILELLKKVERRNVMITGGTALNRMMIANLGKHISGLVVPPEAPYFEALGAALWALDNDTRPFPGMDALFRTEIDSFEALPPLEQALERVTFKTMPHDTVTSGDVCLLGLDVGSTTTKAVLVRRADHALLASVYLRTNGDPVGASRRCYRFILERIREHTAPETVRIVGLGVCGSGRQIAGLHAFTDAVINEIIAHAAAAVYFDPEVDTLFEIGGQDAKYTYITNGVPSDYAMNEACSAGTGSFLEESALESLGVPMTEIADIAMKGEHPPNFNDQCAAFIASDIKNAIHEGIAHEDIVAGLVYSICMNYTNRVKGNRPVGEKVFMQGGVCYNSAVPLAMATLVGKPIVVPPEPGLMGAFGVALEVERRLDAGLLAEKQFDLQVLADREVGYGKSFVCKGGKEKCDRRCQIAVVLIDKKQYAFGGACNRYYNLRNKLRYAVSDLDLVKLRNRLVFETYAGKPPASGNTARRGTVGLNRSFLVNSFYPLYSTFFAALGFEIILADEPSQTGIDMRDAAFCYPAELAHGFFAALLEKAEPPDYLFLPHLKSVPSQNGGGTSQVCPFVQGESFYLQTTFAEMLEKRYKGGKRLLTPLIDLEKGLDLAQRPLIECAVRMGVSRSLAERAFAKGLAAQNACESELKEIGRKAIDALEKEPDKTAVVIFSRPYNGLVEEANMGIPGKLASRGIMVIPMDLLPFEKEASKHHMYWGMGQRILKAAAFVKKHPQLYGTYITNFSCGPDSFLIGYFRGIMGKKPSLTLELDSHTADAGLETRIEAFLDIVAAYRKLSCDERLEKAFFPIGAAFEPARIVIGNGVPYVQTSALGKVPMTHRDVTLLVPSMGRLASEALSAVFRSRGFNAIAHPPADEAVLKIGRANTSCKECLPLILTTGSLLNYIRNERKDSEIVVYFMPTGSGPCRFGQYYVFMEDAIRRLGIPDVALLSLSSENSYAGLGTKVQLQAWWAVVVSDTMEDIRSMLLANAADQAAAGRIFEKQWENLVAALETGSFRFLESALKKVAGQLRGIPLKQPVSDVPMIFMAGEIFVRRDGLSRQYLTEKLAERGFATTCAPIGEWMHYTDYLVERGLSEHDPTTKERLVHVVKKQMMAYYERRIKRLLSASRLVQAHKSDVREVVRNAAPYISENLTGEAVLTIGSSLTEVATHACGVIAVGPFGCMPNRLSEAILNEIMRGDIKLATQPRDTRLRSVLDDMPQLPFLAVESDGSPFPQLIHAKLETFLLRAERLHAKMKAHFH